MVYNQSLELAEQLLLSIIQGVHQITNGEKEWFAIVIYLLSYGLDGLYKIR